MCFAVLVEVYRGVLFLLLKTYYRETFQRHAYSYSVLHVASVLEGPCFFLLEIIIVLLSKPQGCICNQASFARCIFDTLVSMATLIVFVIGV